MSKFLFVGEKPSPKALRIGATWRNGRLSGRTLQRALRAAGIDPSTQRYLNIFVCEAEALRVSRWSIWNVRRRLAEGYVIVALGRKVANILAAAGIPFTQLIHPAARGRIRLAETYNHHVQETLRCSTANSSRR